MAAVSTTTTTGGASEAHEHVPVRPATHLLAGASGGIATAIVTSPLDVLRTRLQSDLYRYNNNNNPAVPTTHDEPVNRQARGQNVSQRPRRRFPPTSWRGSAQWYYIRNNLRIAASIQHQEGWRGFFRGLGPSLAGVVPATAIKFWVYGNCKTWGACALHRSGEDSDNDAVVHAGAAIAAGLATATATNPIWVVKTRLQLESSPTPTPASAPAGRINTSPAAAAAAAAGGGGGRSYRKSFDCTRQILRKEGVPGLYRGLSASYLGSIETALHLVIYEQLKTRYARAFQGSAAAGGKDTRMGELAQWVSTTGAAGSAKLAATLIAYPHEVVRTRLRQAPAEHGASTKYTGLLKTFQLIARNEGVAGLYGGILPHMLRSVPSAIITLGVYEFVLRSLG